MPASTPTVPDDLPGPGATAPAGSTTATAPRALTAPAAAAALTADGSWEELVTTALLGTDRRSFPAGPAGGGRSPQTALLDTAALHTVRRRAGLCPAPPDAPLETAPEDPRSTPPAPAVDRLGLLLADRPGSGNGRRGTTPDLLELLPQWLALANSCGYRAPAPMLPALLDIARGRSDLRPEVLAFAGPRGLWLAALNPDWTYALRATPGSATALPLPGNREAVELLWQEGLFAERVALLAALRRHDAAAGLALLSSTWTKERAEDRLMFLDCLRGDLAAQDEEFLEKALGDRSRNVRATAAELLASLPASALSARMAVRAGACLALGPGGVLTVRPPEECDAAMERDGVAPRPPAGRGEKAWWLGQLMEVAPLPGWSLLLGGLSPAEILARPVEDGRREDLHAAWCRAAVRQGDADWARALLGDPPGSGGTGSGAATPAERSRLLAVLPEAERATWVGGFVAAHGLSEAFQLLGVCAAPWDAALGNAVVDALNIARDAGSYPWSFSGVLGMSERCLDPEHAARLESLTAIPDEGEDASPGAGGYWSESFQRLLATLRLRALMREELLGSAKPGGLPAVGCAAVPAW